MMDNRVLQYFDVFLLVFARMGAMVFTNPVFSRKGVPAMVKTGLVLALSILIVPVAAEGSVAAGGSGVAGLAGVDVRTVIDSYNTFEMVEALLREVITGLVIGSVFQLFFYMLYVAGDLLDTVFGLAMGKVMDPVNGIQTSILGQFVNVFFFLYFFATGCHLLMIKIFAYTYEVIPAGAASFVTEGIAWHMAGLFGNVFLMVIKLALPFVAAEFVLEVTMGVLMKLIPQIHVFVINIQSKIILGILLMMLFAQPVSAFLDHYINEMMGEVQRVMMMFAA